MSHLNKLIDRYLKKENLIDYYITNRICMLVNNPTDFKNIKSNLYYKVYRMMIHLIFNMCINYNYSKFQIQFNIS